MHDVDDFLRQAAGELAEHQAHQQRFEGLLQENASRLVELRQRREAAAAQLGQVALPVASEEGLAALAERLNLPGLKNAASEIALRRRNIALRIQEIEELPAYQRREGRRLHIQQQLEEAEPLFNHARAELQRLEALEGMRELVEERWGTPAYEHQGWLRFFNREFLEDWRRADQIIEALKVSDFQEVAQRFQERLEQTTIFGETVRRLQNEASELDRLEQERVALLAEQAALPVTIQSRAGHMIAQAAASRGREMVQNLLNPDEALRVFAAVDGMDHQVQYLEEMNGKIRGDLSDLLGRSGKLQEEARRYEGNRHRYRNKRFTPDQFGKRFGRTGRYGKIHDRYSRGSQTVYHFHEYDRGASFQDFLWWDVITDGRMDGNWIPEVSEWRESHPSYTYTRNRDVETLSGGFMMDRDDS